MKKSTYLFALALGVSTITFAQNVGINTDGSDPDSDAILHVKDNNADSSVVRVENEQSKLTKFELRNTSAKWDLRIPTGATDLRINNGSGQDHVTIQNDGDVGIGTNSPVSGLEVNTSLGYKVTTINSATTLDNTYNVILCNNGPYTVTLPPAATNTGRVYRIKNIDSQSDVITIDGNGSETIDGALTSALQPYQYSITLISDGANWQIIEFFTSGVSPTANAGAALSAICQSGTSAAMGGSVGGSATGGTWSGGAGTWTNATNPSTATYTADASESGSITLTLTTSGGSFGTTTATKTITVTAANTAGAASSTPTLDVNTALTDITHTTTGATGIGAATGLPAGVTAAWASNTITISGTPTADGTFNYSIPLTGGCGSVNATGTITVNADLTTCGDNVTSTYNGGSVTYGTVLSSTGACWLDRNLGASQVATSYDDYLAYGDLFQWGRGADGHQLITRTNATTSSGVNGSTTILSTTDTPGNSLFIKSTSSPLDWRNPQNDNLWQGVSGTNNPCPDGWRLPTETEWSAELTALSITNASTAANSVLKLTCGAFRWNDDATVYVAGGTGWYWSSTFNGVGNENTSLMYFDNSKAEIRKRYRSRAFSVRCIKD